MKYWLLVVPSTRSSTRIVEIPLNSVSSTNYFFLFQLNESIVLSSFLSLPGVLSAILPTPPLSRSSEQDCTDQGIIFWTVDQWNLSLGSREGDMSAMTFSPIFR